MQSRRAQRSSQSLVSLALCLSRLKDVLSSISTPWESGEASVEIRMGKSEGARAHFDSHCHYELRSADRVKIKRYPKPIRLLHPRGHNYYHMLREKLHWSETL